MYKSKLHFFYTLFTKIFIFVHSYICCDFCMRMTPFTQVLIKTRTVWWQMSPGQFRQSFPVPRFGQPLTSLFILAEFLSWKVSNYSLSKMRYKCTTNVYLPRKLRFSYAFHPCLPFEVHVHEGSPIFPWPQGVKWWVTYLWHRNGTKVHSQILNQGGHLKDIHWNDFLSTPDRFPLMTAQHPIFLRNTSKCYEHPCLALGAARGSGSGCSSWCCQDVWFPLISLRTGHRGNLITKIASWIRSAHTLQRRCDSLSPKA